VADYFVGSLARRGRRLTAWFTVIDVTLPTSYSVPPLEAKGMQRGVVIIIAAIAAGGLFAGLVHGVLVAADVSEPAATTVTA
jgi:hypothetical protein